MSATRILQSCRRCGARERTVLSTRCVVLDALVHQSGLCCLHAMWCWTVWCTRVDCIVYALCGAPERTMLSTCYVVLLLDGVVHQSGLCCLRAVWCWMVWCTRADCVVYVLCDAGRCGAPERTVLSTHCVVLWWYKMYLTDHLLVCVCRVHLKWSRPLMITGSLLH